MRYEETWEEYGKKQKKVKYLIRKARINVEGEIVENLTAKSEEGGRDWYRFLRGEDDSEQVNMKELIVNDRIVKEENERAEVIKYFWEEIGGVSEPVGPSEVHMEMERSIMENMDDEVSKDETERYIKHLKTGKTAGRHEIPNEFY